MTTYLYKGHKISADRELTPEDWTSIIAHIDSLPPKEEEKKPIEDTSWYQDVGAGLKGALHNMAVGVGTAAAGLTTGERQQEIIGYVNRIREQEREHEASLNRGETGKVFKAIGGIPAYLNPATAGLTIAGGAVETAHGLLDEGSSAGAAITGMAADAGINLATMGLAQKLNVTNKLGNAALQSGVNVAQEAGLNRPVQNLIRSTNNLNELPDMTAGDIAAAAIPGAVMGHMMASGVKKPSKNPNVPSFRKEDLTDPFVSNLLVKLDLNVRDIEKLRQKQESFVGEDGTISEKQLKVIQQIEEQIKEIEKHSNDIKATLEKYGIGKPLEEETVDPQQKLIEDIKNLDLSEKPSDLPTEDDFLNTIKQTQNEQISETPFNPNVGVSTSIINRFGKKGVGQNDNTTGKSVIDPAAILEYWNNTATQRVKDKFKSPRGLQLFVEQHEEAHSVVPRKKGESISDYEDRMNKIILEIIDPYLERRSIPRSIHENFRKVVQDYVTQKQINEGLPTSDEVPLFHPFTGEPIETTTTTKSIDTSISENRFPPIEAYVNEGEKGKLTSEEPPPPTELPPGFREPYEGPTKNKNETISPAQLRAKRDRLSSILESVIKRNVDPDTGSIRTPEAKKMIDSMTAQIEKLSETIARGEAAGISFKSKTPTEPPIPVTKAVESENVAPDISSPVFKNKGEELYQSLRNEGKSHTQAQDAVNAKNEEVFQDLVDSGMDPGVAHFKAQEEYPTKYDATIPEIDPKDPEKSNPTAIEITKEADRIIKVVSSMDSNYDIDVSQLRQPSEVLEKMTKEKTPDTSGSIFDRFQNEFGGMGQFVEAVKRDAPIVWETYKRIKKAYDTEVALKRKWWVGDASTLGFKGKILGPLIKLTHWNNPNSPSEIVAKLNIKDKVAITEYMVEASNLMVRHVQTKEPVTDNQKRMDTKFRALTPEAQRAIRVFQNMYDDIQRTTGANKRNGYIHAVRRGDFAVGLKTTVGDVAHIESFPTEEIARNYMRMASEAGHTTTDIIDFKTETGKDFAESFGLVRDVIETMGRSNPVQTMWALKAIEDTQNAVAANATYGKHNVRKEGYFGFKGTELFKTKEQNAEEFFKSMEEFTQASAVQWKKTLLNRDMNAFFSGKEGKKLRTDYPNQCKTSQNLVDVAMNNNQKYKIAEEMDKIREGIDNLFVKGVRKFQELKGEQPDLLYYPDVPVLDKTLGMAAQLFYIRTLTSRPGFWAGQMLSSPFSARQFLKEGTVMESLSAQGKAMGSLMSGGDIELRLFLKDFVNTTDSTHPQFKNEINDIPFFDSKTNRTLDKAFNWVTGQTPAGMADTFSRYVTILQAYHFYKEKGFEGQRLKSNVQNMVDNTMVMYDRTHSPPFLTKLGIVGQQIAPLQKFAIAQMQNLIGDIKYIGQTKGGLAKIRATLPAINTLMTTMIMAGSVGLPLLMEYEMIRKGVIAAGQALGMTDIEDWMPGSVLEAIMTESRVKDAFASSLSTATGIEPETAKNVFTHGALSTATGFDFGSSLRFNPMVPGADDTHDIALVNAFPVIKSTIDLTALLYVKSKKLTGADTTLAEQRKADLAFQIFPGQRALVDEMRYGASNRDYVPGGNRNYAQVEQTPKEQIAMALGTSTLSTIKDRMAIQLEMKNDKKLAEHKQKAIDMITDALHEGDDSRLERGYELADKSGMSKKQIKDQVKAAIHERETPRLIDRYTNQKGQIKSAEQKRKAERMERYD